jgi:hypothetical protein
MATRTYFGGGGGSGESTMTFTNFDPAPIWNSQLATSSLSVPRGDLSAGQNSGFAIFAGGMTTSLTTSGAVDAYNSSLTRTSLSALSTARMLSVGVSFNNNVIISGGATGYTNLVLGGALSSSERYNSSGTRTSGPALSTARAYPAGTASFDGSVMVVGAGTNFSAISKSYDFFDTNFTRTQTYTTSFAYEAYGGAASSVGNETGNDSRIIIAGGRNSSDVSVAALLAFNLSLTSQSYLPSGLSTARNRPSSMRIGDYAAIVGGSGTSTVDFFSLNLTRTVVTLGSTRNLPAATTLGNYGIVGGGHSSSGGIDINIYSKSLSRSTPFSAGQYNFGNLAAASIGDYAIFAGGYTGSSNDLSTSVRAIDYKKEFNLILTTGSKYKINSAAEVTHTGANTILKNTLTPAQDAASTGYTGYVINKSGAF